MAAAKDGDTVRVHYTGTLADGAEFDSSSGGDPLEFTLGAGQMIPGFESAVRGMSAGESKTFTIPSAEAYGPHHPDGVQAVERAMIPVEVEVVVGAVLEAEDQQGRRVMLTVIEATEEVVTLDANHPLAGQDLTFAIELVEIV